MVSSIVALFIFIFGAYAYGYLVMLYLRRHPAILEERVPTRAEQAVNRVSLAMFVMCTVWFVLHATIEFRFLTGEPRENDLIDLAALLLTFQFPGLIFQMFLTDALAEERPGATNLRWTWALWGLYAAGVFSTIYFPSVFFGLLPEPRFLGQAIGLTIGSLFTITSICCLMLMQSRPPRPRTAEQTQSQRALKVLFVGMIVLFVALVTLQGNGVLVRILDIGARTTPLLFLIVSVYFESRIEFYDLVIKRGVLLMLTLVSIGLVGYLSIGWVVDSVPNGEARPWLLAVLLLPVAMVMPWLHDRVGRLLDRWWFGREFAPVEAVKHVLAAMQSAADEPSLIRATESALSDIFHEQILVLREQEPMPDKAANVVEVRTPSGERIRYAVASESGGRTLLSEDLALLRSLGGVFGFLLENVRLHRKRQEQEQLAQDLRLQTSRSELKALRAQINPHFLFNALNAIASLIHTDPVRADAAVEQLAEVFRYTLRRSQQEWAPLDQELAFARAYLDVEQARFGKRLDYSVEAEPAALSAQVPSMLLQTLVENAVKHGISRMRTPGRIVIDASLSGGRLVLEVRDSGPGLDSEDDGDQTGESFGLRSIRDRLQGHFGANATLELQRVNEMTVARLELPFIEDLSPVAGSIR